MRDDSYFTDERLSSITFKTYILDVINSQSVVKFDLDQLQYTKHYSAEEFGNIIAYRLYTQLVGERKTPNPIVYPENWWEAFKERWFPEFLKNKYPVQYTTHHIEFDVFYPDFRPEWGEAKFFVKYVDNSTPFGN